QASLRDTGPWGIDDRGLKSTATLMTSLRDGHAVSHFQIVAGSNSPSTLPVLSANFSTGTPALASKVRCTLASGAGESKRTWRPPFMPWAVPPATRTGRLT